MLFWSRNLNIHILPQAIARKVYIQLMLMICCGVRHLTLHISTQTNTRTHARTHKKISLAIGWLCGKCWGHYVPLIRWFHCQNIKQMFCFNKCLSFFATIIVWNLKIQCKNEFKKTPNKKQTTISITNLVSAQKVCEKS